MLYCSPSCGPRCLPATLQGEVLLAAGDRPPAVGVHVYHSTDGGNSFQDITDAAFSGDTAQVGAEVGWRGCCGGAGECSLYAAEQPICSS